MKYYGYTLKSSQCSGKQLNQLTFCGCLVRTFSFGGSRVGGNIIRIILINFHTNMNRVLQGKRRGQLLCSVVMSQRRRLSLDLCTPQREIQSLARRFTEHKIKPFAAEYDRTMHYPQPIFQKAWETGLLNVHIPASCNGPELGVLDECLIAEGFGWGCTGIATALQINSIASGPLLVAGTEVQQKKYLGRLTEEPLQASFAVTEPQTGSDVASLKTTLRRCTTSSIGGANSGNGDEFELNGEKCWITNAGVANWYFVLAKCCDGEGERSRGDGFTGVIVERNQSGVSVGPKEINLGQRCSDTRSVRFESVRVRKENVVGSVGKGFKLAMKTFDMSRPMIACLAVGLAQRCMDESILYSKERQAMGKYICGHQAISIMLADMACGIEAHRLLAWRAASLYDQGRPNTHYASCAKLLASEHLQKVAQDAVQIFGGNGYNTAYPVEKLYRDAKIYTVYEGTSQIQRMIISRGMMSS